jgi:hypothetical protein
MWTQSEHTQRVRPKALSDSKRIYLLACDLPLVLHFRFGMCHRRHPTHVFGDLDSAQVRGKERKSSFGPRLAIRDNEYRSAQLI